MIKKKRPEKKIDIIEMAIIANRFDGIVREMSNTLLRAARSTVISSCRDFSCCIVTSDHELVASGEGLPVHIFGAHLQTKHLAKIHAKDTAPGDAYLDNDPYGGNSHPADHAIIVPVFINGEILFYGVVKAHMADIGNSIPSSYSPRARDVYEEGSLTFPAVRIQRAYKNEDDIIRMCRARIRVPEQWYGDYLATLGAARIAEKRLTELCAKYGRKKTQQFLKEWFDHSERRMADAIRALPKARVVNTGASDPLENILPKGLTLKVILDIDPKRGIIRADLRNNPPSVECGLNVSRAAAMSSVSAGIFNNLHNVPRNAGSFRRLVFSFAENCVIGSPLFPHSCSTATTNLAERLVNITQSAFAQLGDGFGLAEGGTGLGAGQAVVSGIDHRYKKRYVNRIMISNNGGPATPTSDGWINYGMPIISGLMYRDSVEIDELKHPFLIGRVGIVRDSAGAGEFRGAPAQEIVYATRKNPMTVVIPCDGQFAPPRGVRGGKNGAAGTTFKYNRLGKEKRLPNVTTVILKKGEFIRGRDGSGGGYGNPLRRDPKRVLNDVREGIESVKKASKVYGVAFSGSIDTDDLIVDTVATNSLRTSLLRRKSR